MIRALGWFALIAVLTIVIVLIADIPGTVTVALEDREYRLNLPTAACLIIGLTILTLILFRIISTFVSAPGEFFRWRAMGRRRKGFAALTRGLVAAAAGDDDEARRQSRKAIALVGEPPLALLLAAQAAQIDGNDEDAQRYYTQMLQSKETEFLGLRGLFMAATRRGDTDQAISIAERARALRPKTRWALNALFDLQVSKRAWTQAADALDAQAKAKLIDAAIAKRRRAVLLTASARDAEDVGDAQAAFTRAQEALTQAPGFAPAALIAARHSAAQGRQWKAASLVETAWAQEPHPDLARAYANLKPEEPPQARAKRLASLAGMNPEHPESQILSAAVSISAGRLEEARETLRPLAERFPVARVCLLMADIERGFGGESLIAREWATRAMRAPRDAQWLCSACARTHNEWSATCSACGGFDTMGWQSGTRGTVETMSPAEAAKAYAEATESSAALYRDTVKQDDIRPPSRTAASDQMRDVSPVADEHILYAPPRAPDDPGPDGDEFALSGDDKRRKGSLSW
ncbi:MAG: tetratricopeptide repeat protein [Alphaproteobacteria bacterium]|nr:tetratricopeptide repeat protein [Alphaproteobacteria bacterium]